MSYATFEDGEDRNRVERVDRPAKSQLWNISHCRKSGLQFIITIDPVVNARA